MRIFIATLFSFILIGCGGGYEPIAKYSKNIFEEPVITKVKIDPEDPSTGEYLQDEITKMAVNRLNLTITKNVDKAKSYILVNSYTINTTPETKDENGNIIRYSINAAIEFAIKDKYGFWSKNIVASEFVSVKAESSVSQNAKDKATKIAIKKALDDFMVAIVKRGQKMQKEHKENSNENKDLNNNTQNGDVDNTVNQENVQNDSEQNSANTDENNNDLVTVSTDDTAEKPLVNIVITDDNDTTGLNNESSTPTKILSY